MIRLLATPFVFLVVSFLGSGSGGFSFTIYIGFFIVGISALIIAMSEIGAEGKSIISIYLSPIRAKDFVIGKSVTPILFSSLSAVVIYILIALFDRNIALTALIFMLVAIGVAFEMSLLGLLLGARYPNFSEGPRSAFISQTGALLGMLAAGIIGSVSVGPLLIISVLNFGSFYLEGGLVSSLVVILVACFAFYKLAKNQAGRLLSQLPI